MKKVNLTLTDNEYRALVIMVQNGYFACQSGCTYDEMQTNDIQCDECPYSEAREHLEELIQ